MDRAACRLRTPPDPSEADSPLAIMTEITEKVKVADRAKLVDRRLKTPPSGNLYYQVKRVISVI
jgi:hypothetical protein